MATSGNTSWELTRDQLVVRAFAKIGIPGENNILITEQQTAGQEALNSVIALAVTDGMPLWKRTTQQVTPSTTSQVYTVSDAVKITTVYIRDSSGVQYELVNKSLYDFMRLPRGSVGVPVHWTWQANIQGGSVSIWPLTSDSSTVATKTLQIVYQKEFDGFVSSTDTLDFPSYWTPAIIYQTALMLAPEYGVPLQDRQTLRQEAQGYWAQASGYGDEGGSLFIQPEKRF
jgi:hypothetical protein